MQKVTDLGNNQHGMGSKVRRTGSIVPPAKMILRASSTTCRKCSAGLSSRYLSVTLLVTSSGVVLPAPDASDSKTRPSSLASVKESKKASTR